MDNSVKDSENNRSNSDLNQQLNGVSIDESAPQSDPLAAEDSPETTPEDDTVGDTVFSKHFLFNTLMNIIKLINSEEDSNDSTSDDSRAPIELDEQSEEELCILWDMSANEDVMSFLSENKAIDLFETIIIRTNSPRFAEISAGILANIAVNRDICLNLGNRQHFRQLVIDSLSSSDTPFVIQILRILSISLSNTEVEALWLSTIRDNYEQFFQTIHFSFENCLNCDLLKSELKLINKILYLEDSIGELWLSVDTRNECVKCLVDASNQLLAEDSENIEFLDNLWLCLHSLSLSDNNFCETQLICNRNELLVLFSRYIVDSFGESVDYIIASSHRAGALSAALTLINQMLCLSTSSTLELFFSESLVECLPQLVSNCEQYINHLSEESEEKLSFQMAFNQLTAIQEIYRNFRQKALNSSDIPQQR